jgi:hypothetical protein
MALYSTKPRNCAKDVRQVLASCLHGERLLGQPVASLIATFERGAQLCRLLLRRLQLDVGDKFHRNFVLWRFTARRILRYSARASGWRGQAVRRTARYPSPAFMPGIIAESMFKHSPCAGAEGLRRALAPPYKLLLN